MENIKIETYRGIEIFFSTYDEKFTFAFDTTKQNEKQSFAACKKAIDDFIKQNEQFEPFKICTKTENILEIVSIRKDKIFVDSKGNRLSEYDERNYVIYDESFEANFKKQKEIIEKRDLHYNKCNEELSELQVKIVSKSLTEYKREKFL
jgi:hypothetical protein